MKLEYLLLLARFAQHGVLHREAIKNNGAAILKLQRLGMLKRVRKQKQVFYELTDRALPLLETQRRLLLEQAKLYATLEKRSFFYRALLDDIRFLNVHHPEAKNFLFLGNWDLHRSSAKFQLELAKYRYYRSRGLHS